MVETIKTSWLARFVILVFLLFLGWWVYLQVGIPQDNTVHRFFGAVYGIFALVGGIAGLFVSMKWGGFKSVVGQAIALFSLGLLAQEFGQIAYSYYDYVLHIEGLYPSIGDIGYFGSIPLYIGGIVLLAHASGVTISLKHFVNKIQVVVLPVIMLCVGYFLFLQQYKFDWSHPLTIFLDFGYPFGQAIYISIALLTYQLSRGLLGGMMKSKVLFILFALLIQFLSDYTFLYQTSRGLWHVGQINDFMYCIAYFLMTLGLIQFGTVYNKLRKTN